MSSFSIGAVTGSQSVPPVSAQQQAALASGGGWGIPGPQQAYMGAYMQQPGGVGNIVQNALKFGLLGAGVGAGLGFVASHFGLPIPVIGGLPGFAVGGLLGGLAGAAIGAVKGILENRRNSGQLLPMPAQPPGQIQPGAGTQPPAAVAGKTLKFGQTGALVKTTQRGLKSLGLYNGKITGRMDKATVAAIKRYEIMKGARPTGLSTPDLRAFVAMDVRAAQRFSA